MVQLPAAAGGVDEFVSRHDFGRFAPDYVALIVITRGFSPEGSAVRVLYRRCDHRWDLDYDEGLHRVLLPQLSAQPAELLELVRIQR
jgi:hypothetical protein